MDHKLLSDIADIVNIKSWVLSLAAIYFKATLISLGIYIVYDLPSSIHNTLFNDVVPALQYQARTTSNRNKLLVANISPVNYLLQTLEIAPNVFPFYLNWLPAKPLLTPVFVGNRKTAILFWVGASNISNVELFK